MDAVVNSLPALVRLSQLSLLRSEARAEEKNDHMMRALWQKPWFVEYRAKLQLYRDGLGPRPVYPSAQVEAVERKVDSELRSRYTSYVR